MRNFLMIMLFLTGITALFLGISMMSVPNGALLNIPVNLLSNTSFRDFQIPGLMLVITVSLPCLIALLFYIINHPSRFSWALGAGILTLSWVIAQYVLINGYLLFNALYFLMGLLVVIMAVQLRGRQLI
jgi:hypothetical protein